MKKKWVFILLIIGLTGCAKHPSELKAPCTYNSRSGCGTIVPLTPLSLSNINTASS